MAALGFKAQFAPDVEAGRKLQSIRAVRRDDRQPAKLGGPLTLYSGLRTRSCRKLRETICLSIERIFISVADKAVYRSRDIGGVWHHRHELLSPAETAALIAADGFAQSEDFWRFFDRGDGRYWLIKWT